MFTIQTKSCNGNWEELATCEKQSKALSILIEHTALTGLSYRIMDEKGMRINIFTRVV